MENNPMKTIVESAKNASFGNAVVQLADELNRKMFEHKELGRPKAYREKVYHEGRTAIGLRIFEESQKERERIDGELAQREHDWREQVEKKSTARSHALQFAQNKAGAMSDAELTAQLEKYTTADFITDDPNVVDAYFSESRLRDGITETDTFRELVTAKSYDSPWLQNPESAQLVRERNMYNSAKRFEIPVVDLGGKTASVSLDDFLDGSDAEQGADLFSQAAAV
jgi:hypothetical protein